MQSSIFKNIDFPILVLYLVIVIFGILNISSVLPANGTKQLIFFSLALIVGLSLFLVQSILFESMSLFAYGIGIILLAGVLVLGKEINGAKAWYQIGGYNFQPVELVKICTALILASVVNSSSFEIKSRNSMLQLLIIIGLPVILLFLQPDVGSIMVFTAFFIALYREGFPGYWFILGLYLIVLVVFSITFDPMYVVIGLVVLLLIFIIVANFFHLIQMSQGLSLALLLALILSAGISFSSGYFFEKLPTHQKNRVMVLIEGEGADRDGSGYNLLYSKSAIASGKITGTGYKQGTVTKGKFVPEQHTDYIFCTVGEEWGFVGSAALVIAYALFIGRIYYLSEKSKGTFLRVFGYCFGSIVLMHFLMNIGMVLGLFPTVGIPLPYFSYGGSSLLTFSLMFFIFLRLVYADNSRLL